MHSYFGNFETCEQERDGFPAHIQKGSETYRALLLHCYSTQIYGTWQAFSRAHVFSNAAGNPDVVSGP